MNNLSYYKNLQGVMTQFEPLTEADLQKVDADGLTIPEIKNALEKHGLDLQICCSRSLSFHIRYLLCGL